MVVGTRLYRTIEVLDLSEDDNKRTRLRKIAYVTATASSCFMLRALFSLGALWRQDWLQTHRVGGFAAMNLILILYYLIIELIPAVAVLCTVRPPAASSQVAYRPLKFEITLTPTMPLLSGVGASRTPGSGSRRM
eukprot:GILK01015637.1.p1 GENE.GILK01015637.1~~GILK01015637.1.p1  ORF type:complete len:135 (-),score=10.23 GILK01015637.1:268-672(-)